MNTHPRFVRHAQNFHVANVPAGAKPGNYLTVHRADGTTARVLLIEELIRHDGTPMDRWKFLGEHSLRLSAGKVRQRIDKGHLRPAEGEDLEPSLRVREEFGDGLGFEVWDMNGYSLMISTQRTPLGPAREWSVAGGKYILRIGYEPGEAVVERSGRYIPLDRYYSWEKCQEAVNAGWGFARLLSDLQMRDLDTP